MTAAAELVAGLTRRFAAAGIDSARTDARCLVAFALKVPPVRLRMTPEMEADGEAVRRIEEYAARRLKREPVSKILGTRGFWRLEFKVTPDVLDPRPDSETLIEKVLEYFPDRRARLKILDLGTGSGCLALSLLSEYPDASAVGTDASEKALAVAEENARVNGLSGRFRTLCADWTCGGWAESLSGGSFDVVISNPPYIAESEREELEPEVRLYDPAEALFGGTDGLDAYRQLSGALPSLLKDGGVAVFEFGRGQHDAVRDILCRGGLGFASFGIDLGGIIRCVAAVRRKTA